MKIKTATLLFISFLTLIAFSGKAEETHKPEKVSIGLYITSIHDIDFKQKEYTVDFWLWIKYKTRDFDFANNLEIPQAKTITKSFTTIDSSNGRYYLLMKLQCVMEDSWKISNFPFDRQKLRLTIENSQFENKDFVFVPDTLGKHFDPKFTLRGWIIDSCMITTSKKDYETAFGDESYKTPHTEYSDFRVRLDIKRDGWGLFWKIFLGMYIAFLIAYMTFYIHADGMDSRFGLSVGALFAVIGNKYVVDSSLPESTQFTLADTLHGVTLMFVLCIMIANAYCLLLIKKEKIEKAIKFDRIIAQVLLLAYVGLNLWFVITAAQS